jgi:hypothetical protein
MDTGYHTTYLMLHFAGGLPVEATALLSRHRLRFMAGGTRLKFWSASTTESSASWLRAGRTSRRQAPRDSRSSGNFGHYQATGDH